MAEVKDLNITKVEPVLEVEILKRLDEIKKIVQESRTETQMYYSGLNFNTVRFALVCQELGIDVLIEDGPEKSFLEGLMEYDKRS